MHATIIKSAVFAILGTGWALAANDPFVGKWKLNPAKSQTAGQWVKVEDLGSGKYRFDDGAVVQTYVADGTDQPVEFGGTMSLTKTGETAWKTVAKRDGRLIYESTWTISSDGRALTIHTTGARLDASKFDNEYVMSRTSGTSGLAGTWESKSQKPSSPTVWEIQPHENGLSFVYPSSKSRLDLKFDGKDYAEEGPNAPQITTSARRQNANQLEMTNKLGTKVLDVTEWVISTDGKALTSTVHSTGQTKAEVLVYDRQ